MTMAKGTKNAIAAIAMRTSLLNLDVAAYASRLSAAKHRQYKISSDIYRNLLSLCRSGQKCRKLFRYQYSPIPQVDCSGAGAGTNSAAPPDQPAGVIKRMSSRNEISVS